VARGGGGWARGGQEEDAAVAAADGENAGPAAPASSVASAAGNPVRDPLAVGASASGGVSTMISGRPIALPARRVRRRTFPKRLVARAFCSSSGVSSMICAESSPVVDGSAVRTKLCGHDVRDAAASALGASPRSARPHKPSTRVSRASSSVSDSSPADDSADAFPRDDAARSIAIGSIDDTLLSQPSRRAPRTTERSPASSDSLSEPLDEGTTRRFRRSCEGHLRPWSLGIRGAQPRKVPCL
jgi:hypothetical protein